MQILSTEHLKQLPAVILPQLITLFSSTTPALLAEIQATAKSGDWQTMAQAAHKLKGSCVSLGAEKMADLCNDLQHQGENNAPTGIHELIAELTKIYPVTLTAMQNL